MEGETEEVEMLKISLRDQIQQIVSKIGVSFNFFFTVLTFTVERQKYETPNILSSNSNVSNYLEFNEMGGKENRAANFRKSL